MAIQTRSINKQSQAEARYAFVDAMADINVGIGSLSSGGGKSFWETGGKAAFDSGFVQWVAVLESLLGVARELIRLGISTP